MRKLLSTIGQASVAELCLGGALMGLAGLGGWFSGWLDVVATFAPLWLLMSVLGAALAWPALGREMRRPALVAAVVGVVANLALIGPEYLRPVPRAPAAGLGPPLTVLTFNTWDDNRQYDATVDAILGSGADIVLLQEFFGLSMKARLRLFAAYPYQAGCPAGCDLVMLSKRPWLVGGPTTANIAPYDIAIWGQTSAPDGEPVDVMTLHYQWPFPPGTQAGQRAIVAGVVAGLPKTDLIIAGDNNLAPWTAALKRQDTAFAPMTRRERAVFTWPALLSRLGRRPSPFAILPIDHLYAGPAWKTLSVRRLPRAGSDHFGVVVTLARTAQGSAPAR
ncbi:MAG TPA: endonuclease/exonuclease/phosphatase family protein [Caulobacteraceae bacterium]